MSLFFLPEALGLSSSSLYFVNTCPGRCKASVSPLVLALVDWCLSSTHANVLLSFLLSFPAVQSHSPFLFKFLMKRSWYSWARLLGFLTFLSPSRVASVLQAVSLVLEPSGPEALSVPHSARLPGGFCLWWIMYLIPKNPTLPFWLLQPLEYLGE